MPEKNIDIIHQIWDWIDNNYPTLAGVILSFFTALARERKEGSSMKSSILEALICSFLSMGFISAFNYFNISITLSQFAGIMIGFIGTKKVNEIAESIFIIVRNKNKK